MSASRHRQSIVLVLAAGFLGACGRPSERPVSIVLISIDTLRADRLGAYGYSRDTTPYLDELARESVLFEQALSPAPFTLISHMTMLTGLHPGQHGVLEEGAALSLRVPLLAERVQREGYQTAGLYATGWVDERFGFARGFDVFRSHSDAEEAGRHLTQWLEELDPDRPFFLFLHIFDVHCKSLAGGAKPLYDPPPPFDRMFLRDAPDRLAGVDRRQCWEQEVALSEEQVEALNAMYDGGIRYVDSKLAVWVEGLRDRGLLEHSLLIVTSDHGEALGLRGGVVGGHGGMYQDGLHVPLLVRPPGPSRPGTRVGTPVGLVDIVPTVLGATGLARDPRLPGIPILDAGTEARVFQALQPPWEALVQWPWKVASEGQGEAAAINLDLDPGEASVVLGPLAETLRRRLRTSLAVQLERWPSADLAVGEASAPTEEVSRALDDLGYAGDD